MSQPPPPAKPTAEEWARIRADMPHHWTPLIEAAQNFDSNLIYVPRGGDVMVFGYEPGNPTITVIGDDPDAASDAAAAPADRGAGGPLAYEARGLSQVIDTAYAVLLVSAAATIEHYMIIATGAAAFRHNGLIIETDEPHEMAWIERVRHRPRVLVVTPNAPPTATFENPIVGPDAAALLAQLRKPAQP